MYIELHARSAFSFLEGASTPEELIDICAAHGVPAMALLDRDGVYGSPRFHLAAVKKRSIRAHIGAEVTSAAGWRYPLLVESREGYQNLCRLITQMKLRARKGEGCVQPEEISAMGGVVVPRPVVDVLYRYRNEKRVADIVAFPASAETDVGAPSETELTKFYEAHPDLFRAPEYRGFTVAYLSPADLRAAQRDRGGRIAQGWAAQGRVRDPRAARDPANPRAFGRKGQGGRNGACCRQGLEQRRDDNRPAGPGHCRPLVC